MADEKLKTFLAVVRCGSLTAAAKELYISQPAVTLQIRRLEDEFKIALFHRRERGVELTAAGQLFFKYATRIHDLHEEAKEELLALGCCISGTLRLGATLTIGEYVLPPIIGRFKHAFPQVDVLLEVQNTRKVVEAVASGDLDFGLVEGPFDNQQIRVEKLANDELVIVCSPQHPLARIDMPILEDILSESFILREPGSGTRMVFEEALNKAGVEPSSIKVLMQLGSTQAIKALVVQNVGISVLSQWTVQSEISNGTLHRLNIQAIDLRRTFNFIFKKDARVSQVTRQFNSVCRQHFEIDALNPLMPDD